MQEHDNGVHPLDEALTLSPLDARHWQGKTNAAYANMVGPFGGTTAATLLSLPRRRSRHCAEKPGARQTLTFPRCPRPASLRHRGRWIFFR